MQLGGRYDNPMSESTVYPPRQSLRIWLQMFYCDPWLGTSNLKKASSLSYTYDSTTKLILSAIFSRSLTILWIKVCHDAPRTVEIRTSCTYGHILVHYHSYKSTHKSNHNKMDLNSASKPLFATKTLSIHIVGLRLSMIDKSCSVGLSSDSGLY
jgi:hypothetical protein